MLEAYSLYYKYPDSETDAIKGFSLKIGHNKSIGLIGPNGSGKTSLALALVGLIEPYAGEIRWNGNIVKKEDWEKIRMQIGFTFVNPEDQLFMPTVVEDIAFTPIARGENKDKVHKQATELLKKFDMLELAERFPAHLSSGEKRIVSILGVIISQPDLIILDEPTAFLDSYGRRQVINLLKELPQAKLIISHDFNLIAELCADLIIMYNGKNVVEGESKKILSDNEL